MSTLKVDTLDTSNGTGNINVSRPLSGSGASLTNLPAANLTGTLPALDGSNLTGVAPTQATIEALGIELPAANLTGTVADARISTLTASKLTGALPAISGASLTGISSTSAVFSGTFYNLYIWTPGAYTITGVGFQPDVIWVSQIANQAAPGVSFGGADGVEEHSFNTYDTVSANTWNDSSSSLFKLYSSSGNYVDATLTSMNADGFTYTITETGSYTTQDGTMLFWCWKA